MKREMTPLGYTRITLNPTLALTGLNSGDALSCEICTERESVRAALFPPRLSTCAGAEGKCSNGFSSALEPKYW